jgi:hypothetical protein
MELDLETFLTTLYVVTDDLYQQYVLPHRPAPRGPAPDLSDSEVLCLGLASQWRNGVPWKTERQFVRYTLAHLRPLFPGMTSQSAFNRRLRRVWGALILIQQGVAQCLSTPQDYEIMDCVPVPIARGARSFHPGWLADIARIGKGGNDRFFYGLHLLLVVRQSGVATGWTLAAGNVQDRWLAELLLSSRVGSPQLSGPPDDAPEPPADWVGPVQSCGLDAHQLIVADSGYEGRAWIRHWTDAYGVSVLTAPAKDQHPARQWFSSVRQVVETAFSSLCDSFGLQFPRAHIRWGLLTRIAAKLAAYNVGILINRTLGRPDFAFATLIV